MTQLETCLAPSGPAAAPARSPIYAIGLMSGTSLDGIDAALVRTDGASGVEAVADLTVPYAPAVREALRAVLGSESASGVVAAVERAVTDAHAEAVARLLAAAGIEGGAVAAIGFHGHTVLHAPARRRTWQIGDAARLAAATGIAVVADLRVADVAAGGEGAPLAPVFHAALAAALPRPLAVLNVGGVANATWIGAGDELLAFDTGPGNALIDDLVRARTGASMDRGGSLAAAGTVDRGVLARLLDHPYFDRPPPKSLDRGDFDGSLVDDLETADAAATLTRFTAEAVARGLRFLPAPPLTWLVTGGGRHNPTLMAALGEVLAAPVAPVETVGWNGDGIEAQAFAYLAVRSLYGLPITFPGTTGAPAPMTGGRLVEATAAG